MTRVGKIARLPRDLRLELNHRLAEGEPAGSLAQWLNSSREVWTILKYQFGGRPITEQNLSEWKQGGYQDWLRHEDARDFASGFLDRALELRQEVGVIPLADCVSDLAALTLLRLLQEAETGTGPERRCAVLEIVRELQRLRRGDHQMARLRLEQERWERKVEAEEEQAAQEIQRQLAEGRIQTRVRAQMFREEYCEGLADGTITPERARQIREYFEEDARWLRYCGVPGLPPEEKPANQSESDQIKPDSTNSSGASGQPRECGAAQRTASEDAGHPTESDQIRPDLTNANETENQPEVDRGEESSDASNPTDSGQCEGSEKLTKANPSSLDLQNGAGLLISVPSLEPPREGSP